MLYNTHWGTICDDHWDINDANVVCRQLGFSSGAVTAYSDAHFGRGCGTIWLDDLQCDGSESNLFDCTHRGIGSHNCSHQEDAGVTCRLPCYYIYNYTLGTFMDHTCIYYCDN